MITSPKNERIKDAHKLQRKRHRNKMGLILVEGARLIADALRSHHRPATVFYSSELIGSNPTTTRLLDELMAMNVDCFDCTPAALAPLTETVVSQGIVAIFPQPPFRLAGQADLILVLDQLREPGNFGTLLRSAEAAGVDQVLVAPNTVDPYNDKAVRAAMGAHFRLPIQPCSSWRELTNHCLAICPLEPTFYLATATAEQSYDEVDWSQPAVVTVGGEADGASEDAVNRSQALRIPMVGETESLNAAIAGSIILFEAARQRRTH